MTYKTGLTTVSHKILQNKHVICKQHIECGEIQAELHKVQTSVCEGPDNNVNNLNFNLIILHCENSSCIVSSPHASSHSNDARQHLNNSKTQLPSYNAILPEFLPHSNHLSKLHFRLWWHHSLCTFVPGAISTVLTKVTTSASNTFLPKKSE